MEIAFSTNNTQLAAALLTMGVSPFGPDGKLGMARLVHQGRELWTWNFNRQQASDSVAGAAPAVEQLWNNWREFQRWEAANPKDPLAFIRLYEHNKERMIDLIKQATPVHVVERDGKFWLVPTPEK